MRHLLSFVCAARLPFLITSGRKVVVGCRKDRVPASSGPADLQLITASMGNSVGR